MFGPPEQVGNVFRVEAPGTPTLHAFAVNENPVGELVEIDDGSLYGATVGGTVPGVRNDLPGQPGHGGVRDPL